MHGIHHRTCGEVIPKIGVYAARKMYVIGIVEVEETVSILRLEEPAVSFSLEEDEGSECQCNQDELDWSIGFDEFDLAEISGMRERFGLIRER